MNMGWSATGCDDGDDGVEMVVISRTTTAEGCGGCGVAAAAVIVGLLLMN